MEMIVQIHCVSGIDVRRMIETALGWPSLAYAIEEKEALSSIKFPRYSFIFDETKIFLGPFGGDAANGKEPKCYLRVYDIEKGWSWIALVTRRKMLKTWKQNDKDGKWKRYYHLRGILDHIDTLFERMDECIQNIRTQLSSSFGSLF